MPDGRATYRHNEAGLRANQEYAPTPPQGVKRLAAYGDSFTYCYEVDFNACWTRQLERLMPDAEVLNFGVPGYGPDQAWLRYQLGGAGWNPCAVLIGSMAENVNRVVNRYRPFYWPHTFELAKPRYLLQGDQLTLLPIPTRRAEDLKSARWVEENLGPHDAWYFPGMFVANPLDGLQLVRVTRSAAYRWDRQQRAEWSHAWAERAYRPGGEAFEVLAAELSQFARQVRADGATPVVVFFPSKVEILAELDGRSKAHAPLINTLRQRDVPTLDLTDPLVEEARRSGVDAVVKDHYRPLGNTTVAQALGAQLPDLTRQTCGQ